MQPFLRLLCFFFETPLETTEGNQFDAFTSFIHPQAGLPCQSSTLFTLLVPKCYFQKPHPPLTKKNECANVGIHVELKWVKRDCSGGQRSVPLIHETQGYYFRVPPGVHRVRKMWPLFPEADNPQETSLMPRRKEMDTKTVG